MNPFDLQGKVAFVTGASSGLGASFARALAEAGADVVLAARRVERIEALAEEITQTSDARALPVALDVTDKASCEAAIATAENALGPISILVNNAGVERTKPFMEGTEEDWDFVMDANLKAVWRLGQLVSERMIQQGVKGSVINIASILGLGVFPNQSTYATSKAAVIHLTQSMAVELFQHGIRVNAICPGYFRTEMTDSFLDSEHGQAYVSRTPARRAGELDELTGPLLMLASDASSFVTGAAIPVDGGHSIRLV